MSTFKITVAYDGTGYVGWQRQATGVSIQGLLEDALAELAGGPVAVAGAGRTDAGVHALGQVASFSIERDVSAPTVLRAVNARLPPAVRVVAADTADAGFHARFSARSKTYRYRIWNADVMDPFERAYAWHVPEALDTERMARAARVFEGTHDFAAFQARGGSARSTERRVTSSRVIADGALVTYEISGTGFLRHMVRAMAGSLVEAGRGRGDEAWVERVLGSRDRTQAGPTAPPGGLFLARVDYEPASPDRSSHADVLRMSPKTL